MSKTYSLVCHDTKQCIWVGQGWDGMEVFYSGVPKTMRRLGRFLRAHEGKPLYLLCDDNHDMFAGYDGIEDSGDKEQEDPFLGLVGGPYAVISREELGWLEDIVDMAREARTRLQQEGCYPILRLQDACDMLDTVLGKESVVDKPDKIARTKQEV